MISSETATTCHEALHGGDLTLKGMLLPVKGEVISDCRENADPAESSPARFVTTATDARIIMQTSTQMKTI